VKTPHLDRLAKESLNFHNTVSVCPVRTPLTTPDIMPTLLGLAGLKIPQTVEGEDLSGIVRGGAGRDHGFVVDLRRMPGYVERLVRLRSGLPVRTERIRCRRVVLDGGSHL